MKKLGIYGGTFSPPHIGHRHAAEIFLKAAELDELLIMPAFIPPHKTADTEATPNDRLEMCKLAFEDLEKTAVSDFEIQKGGKSYTYLTLTELKEWGHELFFLVGTDMFVTLGRWRRPDIIFSLATIVLVRREDEDENSELIKKRAEEYRELYGARILISDAEAITVSSSELREKLKSGIKTPLLSKKVADYIKEKGLYAADFGEESLNALELSIKDKLSPARYLHSLRVKDAALKIAEFCYPEKKSELCAAALLHDIAKEIPREEQLEIMKLNPTLNEEDYKSEKLYHAFCAPHIIKRDYPAFASADILSSVFNHTTGSGDMSLFDEIIFVADYIEDTRVYPECIKARDELFSSFSSDREKNVSALHRCALSELLNTAEHISKRSGTLNPRTEETIKYIKMLIDKTAT